MKLYIYLFILIIFLNLNILNLNNFTDYNLLNLAEDDDDSKYNLNLGLKYLLDNQTDTNDQSRLKFSSFFGGSSNDGIVKILTDKNDSIYLTGKTTSLDFPTKSAFQPTLTGDADIFLTKFILLPYP